MTVCFGLAGAYGTPDTLKYQLKGKPVAGTEFIPIGYPSGGVEDWRIELGRDMLDEALTSTTGIKRVIAHSAGARAANLWLHDYGPSLEVDPTELEFWLFGDSSNRFGGSFFDESFCCPVDTPYKVNEIINQYDGWADGPQDRSNQAATTNAAIGAGCVHPDYFYTDPDPNAAGNYSKAYGNVTYIYRLIYPLPVLYQPNWVGEMYGFKDNFVVPTAMKSQDQNQRLIIEAAYTGRAAMIPLPDYTHL